MTYRHRAAMPLPDRRRLPVYRPRRYYLVTGIALCILGAQSATAGDAAADTSANAMIGQLASDALSASLLDASGSVVGEIMIDNGNVFDTGIAGEDRALYRAANVIHRRTNPEVIRQQLLFASGEVYSSRLLEESERILRADPYIQEVRIAPVRHANGRVDVRVTTKDAWTLRPSLNFSRSGGENSGGIGFDELNLFGTGIRVGTKYRSNVDRDSLSFQYLDSHVGDGWTQLHATYATNSDGFERGLRIEQPFYALDSRFAAGVTLNQDDRIDSFYDRGERQSRYRGESQNFEAYAGWSKGLSDGWTRRIRAGLAYEDHVFTALPDEPFAPRPDDRRFAYPFVGIEFVEDEYEKAHNLEQIDQVEDRNLGLAFSARLGYAGKTFGSDRDALLLQSSLSRGFGSAADNSLMLSADLHSRWENGGAQNLALELSAKYFNRQTEKSLFFAGLSGTFGQNTDLDALLPLGGDSGLRGYPLRYQMGESRALLTLEQRYFTDWYPFRLVHVGAAVFADIGRSFGNNPVGGPNPGLLRDVGFGLRLGNNRSALGRVVHIDLAYPLDGDGSISNVQFLVGTKRSF
jgi:hypothetical protein